MSGIHNTVWCHQTKPSLLPPVKDAIVVWGKSLYITHAFHTCPPHHHVRARTHTDTLLNKQILLSITFTVYKPVYWYALFHCCWCCSAPQLAVFYRTETPNREAGTLSMQHPVSHLCVRGEATGSSPLHWKSRKLMTADTLPGGLTARVFAFPLRCLCACAWVCVCGCFWERERGWV